MEYTHRSVLLDECIEGLNIKPDGIYLDGTLGRAGHSREIVKRLTTGRLICVDRDDAALEAAKAIGMDKLAADCGVGIPTLNDIIKELMKPGRDPRDELPAPLLRTDVKLLIHVFTSGTVDECNRQYDQVAQFIHDNYRTV